MNGWFQLCVFVKSGTLLPLGQQKKTILVCYLTNHFDQWVLSFDNPLVFLLTISCYQENITVRNSKLP